MLTLEQFEAIARLLVERALAGERWAIREVLDRCLGKATLPIEMDVNPQRLDLTALWQGSVDDLIELARMAGKVDELPPRLQAIALGRTEAGLERPEHPTGNPR